MECFVAVVALIRMAFFSNVSALCRLRSRVGHQSSLTNSVRWLQTQSSTNTDLYSELKELIPPPSQISAANGSALNNFLTTAPWSATQRRGITLSGSDVRVGNLIENKGRAYEVLKQYYSLEGKGKTTIKVPSQTVAGYATVATTGGSDIRRESFPALMVLPSSNPDSSTPCGVQILDGLYFMPKNRHQMKSLLQIHVALETSIKSEDVVVTGGTLKIQHHEEAVAMVHRDMVVVVMEWLQPLQKESLQGRSLNLSNLSVQKTFRTSTRPPLPEMLHRLSEGRKQWSKHKERAAPESYCSSSTSSAIPKRLLPACGKSLCILAHTCGDRRDFGRLCSPGNDPRIHHDFFQIVPDNCNEGCLLEFRFCIMR
ncbi:hypothetical protein RIF29_18597 [Crotalaria pallida]|uniref:Uncharacterized protein n=1 Tax=Crotalaria pallida TaxID=3830 RepID=A0AAN9EYG6_CROPI